MTKRNKKLLKKTLLVLIYISSILSCLSKEPLGNSVVENNEINKLEIITPKQLTAGSESNFAPNLSSDGDFIAYTSDKSVNKDIWIKSIKGGSSTAVTTHAADDYSPVFSPNGKNIAFISRRYDAAGNVHVIRQGLTFKKIITLGEKQIDMIDSPKTEDLSPAWYPDNENIVFTARKYSDKNPQLMKANISDLKVEPLVDAIGLQPSVSQDGSKIVYIYDNAIYIYHEKEKRVEKIIGDGISLYGQPKFFNNDHSLVFIRYMDDTNKDGKINANDFPTIWTLHLPEKSTSNTSSLNTLLMTPLTNASFASFNPQIKDNTLYFAKQNELGLDIFYLPKEGQLKNITTLESANKLFEETSNKNLKTFILRKAIADLNRSENISLASEAAYSLLKWHVTNDDIIEANFLYKKLSKAFENVQDIILLSKIAMAELKLSPWSFPKTNRNLSDKEKLEIKHISDNLDSIFNNNKKDSSSISPRIKGELLLLKAKIQAASRNFLTANETLSTIINDELIPEKIKVESKIYSGYVIKELIDVESSKKIFIGIVKKHPNIRSAIHKASEAIVNLTEKSKNQMKDLTELVHKYHDLPVLPAMAHLKISNIFLSEGKELVAANELRQILTDYPNSPEIVLIAAKKLVSTMIKNNRISELEQLMFDMHDLIKLHNPIFQKESLQIVITTLLQKAEISMKDMAYQDALEIYLTIKILEPENTAANRGIIKSNYHLGTLESLIAELEEDLDDKPNDAISIYLLAYANTYKIDKNGDLKKRLSVVDDIIDMLLTARSLDSQNSYIHQTLGWLYFQKYHWTKKLENQGHFWVQFKNSFQIFLGFWGLSQSNPLEQAIDSYLSSYFLTEADSYNKANISQNLANAYYLNKNYPKALTYYMQRLKNIDKFPITSQKIKGNLFHQAGRSAFHVDEFKIAESLQRNEIEIWQQNNDEEMALKAMDSLALTMSQNKKLTEAENLYQSIIEAQTKLSMTNNIAKSLINFGYVSYQLGKYQQALNSFNQAEEAILKPIKSSNSQKETKVKEKDGIVISLGGQSEANGFSKNTQLQFISTLRARIFEHIEDLENSISAYQKTISILQEKIKINESANEDLAIAYNNLGTTAIKAGDHLKALEAFDSAIAIANKMRPKDQKWMIKDEWINLINKERLQLRLAKMGVLTQAQITEEIKNLSEQIKQLEAMKKESKGEEIAIAKLVTILEILKSYDQNNAINFKLNRNKVQLSTKTNAKKSQNENIASKDLNKNEEKITNNIELFEAINYLNSNKIDRKYFYGSMLAWNNSVGDYRFSDAVNSLHPSFRNEILKNKEISWKYQYINKNWRESFNDIWRYIYAGGVLENPVDNREFRFIFEQLLHQTDTSAEQYRLFRRYKSIEMLSLVRSVFQSNDNNTKEIKLSKSDEDDPYRLWTQLEEDQVIQDILEQNNAVLSAHRTLNNQLWLFLQTSDDLQVQIINLDEKNWDSLNPIQKSIKKFHLHSLSLKHLFIIPSSETYKIAWEKINIINKKNLNQILDISFIPQIDILTKIWDKKSQAKFFVGSTDDKLKLNSEIYNIRSIKNTLHHSNSSQDVASTLNLFNIIHDRSALVLNSSKPRNSKWYFPKTKKEELTPEKQANSNNPESSDQYIKINQIANLNLQQVSLIVFENVSKKIDLIHQNTGAYSSWAVLSYALLNSGIPSYILNEDKFVAGNDKSSNSGIHNDWNKFYDALTKNSIARAIEKSDLRARLIGYPGDSPEDFEDEAEDVFESLLEKAEEYEDEEEWNLAAKIYASIYAIGLQVEDEDRAHSALFSARNSYFKARDYQSAFHLQKILAEQSKEEDQEEYIQLLTDAASLATRAENFEESQKLYSICEDYYTKEEDLSALGKIWREKAIDYEKQNKYTDAINAYTKSREYHLEEDELKEAAQILLNQGNLFNVKLNDYQRALELYQQSAQEFYKMGDKEAYYKIQIDRSNAFNKLGQPRKSIEILSKTLKDLDPEKDLIQWIRTSQGLANGYYLAGKINQASSENTNTYTKIDEIENEQKAINQKIEADNLKAMILGKMGRFDDAFSLFKNSIQLSEKYNLQQKKAMLLNNYGYWQREVGDTSESIKSLQEAMVIDTKLGLKKDLAFDQRNLAISLIVFGNYNKAQDLLQSSLNTSKNIGITYNETYCLFALGDIFLRQNQYEESINYFSKAYNLSVKSSQPSFIWRALTGLALNEQLRNNHRKAISHFENAVNLVRAMRPGLSGNSSVTKMISEIGIQELYELYIVSLIKNKEQKYAWEINEEARHRLFLDAIASHAISNSSLKISSDLQSEESLLDEITLLNINKLKSDKDDSRKETQGNLKEKFLQLANVQEKMLKTNKNADIFLTFKKPKMENILKKVPKNTAIIEYKITKDFLIIWIMADNDFHQISINTSKNQLKQMVDDFRKFLQNYSETKFIGNNLYEILIKPAEKYIQNKKKIIIIPDLWLYHLPFSALEKDNKFLIEDYVISYFDSAVNGFKALSKNEKPNNTDYRIFALASPFIKDKANIPFTIKEANSIKRYFPNTVTVENDKANKMRLKSEVGKYNVYHIASHSEFNSDFPIESKIFLSGNTDDSALKVSDIFSLGINADLVTLSGCDSGLNINSSGVEVIGMNRAFHFAGADNVLASLWRIDDVASAVVIKRFYRYLSEGLSKAEALRKSQLSTMKYFPHPVYWSAFKLTGL
ncbi:MAG: CHAT domain-containing protein [Bdellovibrionota bacterium]